ncbi:MAG: Flp pilus assembly complex ATPase component TadA [Phycisphaeraceae bacterium]|nr:Flp pilus assembly complex ATPase component TadA [Phycisphaeraceae bacterium]
MGRFDIDDLLEDLSRPDPQAPREPGTSPAAAPADALFRRNDPSETPRPPDLSGSGLGREVAAGSAARKADPLRVRPGDALTEIHIPSDRRSFSTHTLMSVLVDRGIATAEHAATIERLLKQSPGAPLVPSLLDLGIDEVAVQQVVAGLAGMTFERIDFEGEAAVDARSMSRLGPDFFQACNALPLRREGIRLVVGTPEPSDVFVLDEIKRRLGIASIRHVLVTRYDIRGYFELQKEDAPVEGDIESMLAEIDEDEDVEVVKESIEEATLDEADSSPVVRYVNRIIQTAVREGASDIHIEPEEKSIKVRFRIDGILFEMMNPPKKMHAALTSRIKIMANLDIAERRLPQDGRIRATVGGRTLDLRVSTVPTPKGEKTVMRILDNRAIRVRLDELGFNEDTATVWRHQIAQPHGVILVTGPTGSGKTTTLYASLQELDLRKMNVSTVEDPVEYNLQGITQIQTHERIGMTFAAALRALLRQDPDVIMVGEIRDMETATIAIQASMTGHLVLSTLHTNDAPASITRLINIGIEPFLVGAACNAVLAQRLVRRICSGCGADVPVSPDMVEILSVHGLNSETLRKGKGCSKCRETGYSGRLGLYELLALDDFLRDAIARNPNVTEFRRQCSERGMVTLREDGFRKVITGQTTVEEVLRVTESTI